MVLPLFNEDVLLINIGFNFVLTPIVFLAQLVLLLTKSANAKAPIVNLIVNSVS
jgi:hypothetical protein